MATRKQAARKQAAPKDPKPAAGATSSKAAELRADRLEQRERRLAAGRCTSCGQRRTYGTSDRCRDCIVAEALEADAGH